MRRNQFADRLVEFFDQLVQLVQEPPGGYALFIPQRCALFEQILLQKFD